jgi:hypothetical protein
MNRQKASGGQAIVMVTLALISMSGMMGLAVDLGWSYFSQKAAQGAADEAALSAVQRAYASIIKSGNTASAFITCGTMGVTCATSWASCVPTGLGNLQSGCIYARNAGFTPGGHNGKQNVLIQANVPPTFPDSIPDSPGSPKDIVYWVSVKTYESIPSLFSSMLGNSNGAISAVATAAIASKIVPGSFYGMNQQGDCFTANGTKYCGVDLVGGGNSGACPSGPSAFLCAPAGAFIASTCNGTPSAGCSGNGAYAGSGSMNGGPGINIPVANALDPAGTWTPSPTVTSSVGYQDPTQGQIQPPLASSSAAKSCGISGAIPNNTVLGPYQYYHYTVTKGGLPDPDGAPINLPPNASFAANGTCPGVPSSTGASQSSSTFPMYVFYGGLSTGGAVTFGAGQYVMAGVTGTGTDVFHADSVNMTTTGAGPNYSGSGNLFIFTDQNYPGLSTQLSTVPNNSDGIPAMQFGSVYLKGGSTSSDLFGLANNSSTGTTNLPPALNGFGGILFWQDRANSTVTYDVNGKVTSQTNPICPVATCVSPQLLIDNLKNNLHGVMYQPRGAWTLVKNGSTSQLQLMTGAVVGSSTGYVQLTSPTNQMIRYLPVLIQ